MVVSHVNSANCLFTFTLGARDTPAVSSLLDKVLDKASTLSWEMPQDLPRCEVRSPLSLQQRSPEQLPHCLFSNGGQKNPSQITGCLLKTGFLGILKQVVVLRVRESVKYYGH